MRANPNIIITGTPGVGKTTHAEALAERTGLKHVSVNQVVKDKGCHEGWDDEFLSWIVDEDKVCFFFGLFLFLFLLLLLIFWFSLDIISIIKREMWCVYVPSI